jgi:hypothetical protein
MRKIKVIILSLVILSVLVLLFSLLIPTHSKVSRAINIVGTRDSLRNELLQLKKWVNWHPFLKARPIDSIRFSSANQLEVDHYAFSITGNTDSTIQFLAQNPRGEQMPSTIAIYNYGDSCIVNWYSSITVKWYPWEKFKTIFYDNMYGPALDSNLIALKYYIEKKP